MTIALKTQLKKACEGCEYTRNCINGLFCTKLKIYVEYKEFKVCTQLKISK